MENFTSGNGTVPGDTDSLSALQIVSTIIFVLSTLTCLSAYILVISILLIYFKEFKSYFYYAVISMGIADILFLALVLFYCVPSTIQQRDIWERVPHLAGALEALSYFSQCNHLTYIAANHLVRASGSRTTQAIVEKIFNRPVSVALWIALIWVLSVPLIIASLSVGCYEIYDYNMMSFLAVCLENVTDPSTIRSVTLANNVVSGFLPSATTALYISAWSIVRWKGRRAGGTADQEIAQRGRRQRRILIQFTLSSAALLFNYISFWTIPAAFGEGNDALVLITYCSIFSAGVNPFIYLSFNRVMKAKAKYIIYTILLRRSNNKVNVGGTTPIHVLPMRVTSVRDS